MTDHETRRRVLQGSATAALLALAGCAGGDATSDDGTDGEDETNDGDEMDDGEMDGDEMDGDEMDDGEMDGDEMDGEDMSSESVAMTVRIENVASGDAYASDASTGGAVWVTPGAYAVHEGANPIHEASGRASVGLEALAEAGLATGFDGEPGLVGELAETDAVAHAGAYGPADTTADPNDPTGEVPGAPPVAPGGTFEFEVEAEPGHRFSFASMFVPSNDLYLSPATGIEVWPEGGDPVEGDVTDGVGLWDAGTEPNGRPGFGADQAPAQDASARGGDEDGVVRPIGEVDDGHDYPAADEIVRVTVTPR